MAETRNALPLDQIIFDCQERQKLKLYHGSLEFVSQPKFGLGSVKNDFGRGFYCTEVEALAKEWAAQSLTDPGYCNQYSFDISKLNVLDLTSPRYNLLNWATLLFKYRDFATHSYAASENMKYLQNNFSIDISPYDVIIGYRADDSYFAWAKDFVEDQISLEQLNRAMLYGGLGEQIVLISEKAFSQITFDGYEEVDASFFYKRRDRAVKADKRYFRKKKTVPIANNELTASKIREGGLTNEDFCISRDVPRNSGR